MTGTIETLPASPCSANSDLSVANVRAVYQDSRKPIVNPPQHPSVDNLHGSPTSQPASKRARTDPHGHVGDDFDEQFAVGVAASLDHASSHEDRKQALLLRLQKINDTKARLKSATPSMDHSSSGLSPAVVVSSSQDNEVQFVTACHTPQAKRAVPTRRSTRSKKAVRDSSVTKHPCTIIDVDNEVSLIKLSDAVEYSSTPKKSKSQSPGRSSRRFSTRTPKPRVPHGDNASRGSDHALPMPSCMSKCKRLQFCKKLTSTLLKDRRSAPFSAPVKELWHSEYIPDYFKIISHPMDLGTIRKNLDTRLYVRPVMTDVLPFRFDVDKFANDIRLVFRNAIIYNREGDILHNDAHCLLEDFERTMKEQLPVLPQKTESSLSTPSAKKRNLPNPPSRNNKSSSSNRRGRGKNPNTTVLLDDIDEHHARHSVGGSKKGKSQQEQPQVAVGGMTESELDAMTSEELKERLQYLKNCREPVVSRMPIPKGEGYLSRAALLYAIPISSGQIRKCISAICDCRVAPEKMPALAELIKQCKYMDGTCGKASHDPTTGDFEAELDQLNNESWRKIESFLEEHVPTFKTARSSTLGREFSTLQEVDSEAAMIRSRLVKHAEMKLQSTSTKRAEKPKSFFSAKDGDDGSSSESSSDSESDSSGSSASDSSDESGSDTD